MCFVATADTECRHALMEKVQLQLATLAGCQVIYRGANLTKEYETLEVMVAKRVAAAQLTVVPSLAFGI